MCFPVDSPGHELSATHNEDVVVAVLNYANFFLFDKFEIE